jgi:hypothetical protein
MSFYTFYVTIFSFVKEVYKTPVFSLGDIQAVRNLSLLVSSGAADPQYRYRYITKLGHSAFLNILDQPIFILQHLR